jgi:hypothetical protein
VEPVGEDKVEHNPIEALGGTALIDFTVCRDYSVVERAKFKYRIWAEDWAKKHKQHHVVVPIVVGTRGVFY